MLDDRLKLRVRGRGVGASRRRCGPARGWPSHGVGPAQRRRATRSASPSPTARSSAPSTGAGPAELVHPGAVYLHQGRSYRVAELDLDDGAAIVEPDDGGEYTQARTDDRHRASSAPTPSAAGRPRRPAPRRGRGASQVIGYQRVDALTGELLGTEDARPARRRTLVTRAFWYSVDRRPARRRRHRPRPTCPGTLHAVEHAAIGILPLFTICDRWDVGGVSTAAPGRHRAARRSSSTTATRAGPASPSSATTRPTATCAATLEVHRARAACTDGCPSCVQSPKCGNGNEPLDKARRHRPPRGPAPARHRRGHGPRGAGAGHVLRPLGLTGPGRRTSGPPPARAGRRVAPAAPISRGCSTSGGARTCPPPVGRERRRYQAMWAAMVIISSPRANGATRPGTASRSCGPGRPPAPRSTRPDPRPRRTGAGSARRRGRRRRRERRRAAPRGSPRAGWWTTRQCPAWGRCCRCSAGRCRSARTRGGRGWSGGRTGGGRVRVGRRISVAGSVGVGEPDQDSWEYSEATMVPRVRPPPPQRSIRTEMGALRSDGGRTTWLTAGEEGHLAGVDAAGPIRRIEIAAGRPAHRHPALGGCHHGRGLRPRRRLGHADVADGRIAGAEPEAVVVGHDLDLVPAVAEQGDHDAVAPAVHRRVDRREVARGRVLGVQTLRDDRHRHLVGLADGEEVSRRALDPQLLGGDHLRRRLVDGDVPSSAGSAPAIEGMDATAPTDTAAAVIQSSGRQVMLHLGCRVGSGRHGRRAAGPPPGRRGGRAALGPSPRGGRW